MARTTRRDVIFLGAGLAAGAAAGLWLRRSVPEKAHHLRPPGAHDERRFQAACIRCGQCVQACPFDVLRLLDVDAGLDAGTPVFDARTNPCTLCEGHGSLKCIDICPTDALLPLDDPREARIGTAEILTDICLAHLGTVCRACWHACPFPDEAIRLGAMLRPEVVNDACVGCGLCEQACPTEEAAIVVRPPVAGKRA